MSLGISITPHRDVVQKLRSNIRYSPNFTSLIREKDVEALDAVHEDHIKSKTEFFTSQSDYTMVHLIGTWTRLQRTMWMMEDKYGRG